MSFAPISSSRFNSHLLECLLHPIITNPSIRENSCIYSCLATKERHYSTLTPSIFSCINTSSCIFNTLDYLVPTSLSIQIKLDFNKKTLFFKTLTLFALESLICNSAFNIDYASFRTMHCKSSLITLYLFILFEILFSIKLFILAVVCI